MTNNHGRNRKLLVSVFDAQEAREAVLGGGRIIDSEDPRSALGNIKPRQIMAISDAVLHYQRDLDVQLSTNIGEDQLLFDRSETGQALEKSPYEIAGKAAQSAIGVSCAMGTRVHPCNLVKVGVDGMNVALVKEVLEEVVLTLNRTEHYSHCQVMSVLFAQDIATWDDRKAKDPVRKVLVELREFHICDENDPEGFELKDYAVDTLRDRDGRVLFKDASEVSLGALVAKGVLPEGANHSIVKLNELFPHSTFFPSVGREHADPHKKSGQTTRAVIKAMVDATAEAGADSIMLDTRIQSKVSRVCLVDTGCDGMVDINKFDISGGIPRQGVLTLDDLRYFVDYCHYREVEANLAGSVQSYQAQQLWLKIPHVDQVSTRGASSGVSVEPGIGDPSFGSAMDTRQHRKIKRHLVRGLAPPEHGGVVNFPIAMKDSPAAVEAINALCAELREMRCELGLPELKSYYVTKTGEPQYQIDEAGKVIALS